MHFNQLFGILRARWKIIAIVFLVTVGATALVTRLLPKGYTATTTIVIEPRSTDVLGANPSIGTQMLTQSYMATQLDILQSQRVAVRAVQLLGVPQSPSARAQWQREARGGESIEIYFADLLQKRLDIRPSRESSVVTVAFDGAEPVFAAQVANAFAQAYLETNLDLRTAPAKQYASWFNEQLKELRGNLETAQSRVSAYQQANGIVAIDERLDVENARLVELSSQLVAAQSAAFEARSRARQGDPTFASTPDVSATPILQMLRADLARAEAKLQDISARVGTGHPSYQSAIAEIGTLRERIADELRHASGAVDALSRVATRRESDLVRALDVQKQRLLEFKRRRDEMAVLSREVENAQRVYELALQRFAQNSLDGQSNQASAYVLNRATPPAIPSSPRTLLNLALSAVLGMLLGVAFAILRELADRRVRSADDLAHALDLPILGGMPSTRRRRFALPRARWVRALPAA